MKKIVVVMALVFSVGAPNKAASSITDNKIDQPKLDQLLMKGRELLVQKKPKAAIEQYFDKVINLMCHIFYRIIQDIAVDIVLVTKTFQIFVD